MGSLVSHDDVNDQGVIPTNHIGVDAAITVQQCEHHLGGPQPSPQTTDTVIVMEGVRQVQLQQPAAVAADQNLQIPGDDREVVDLEVQLGVNGDLTLVPNRSDPIARLRYFTISSFVSATIVGVLSLPEDLHRIHTTYGKAKLIASVGTPITVAAFSFASSFWLAYDPNGRNNWITGLTALNVSMHGGPLAVYWMLTRGTEN